MNGSRQLVGDLLPNLALYRDNKDVDIVVCPPFTSISACYEHVKDSSIFIGAQNLSTETEGAFTGEISAAMLLDQGCKHVIVGHSERRALYGESDKVVAKKARIAFDHGLIPIICVGESLDQRNSGDSHRVVLKQLESIFTYCGLDIFPKAIVAYEPIWAIGTGMTATGDQAQEIHKGIRESLNKASPGISSDTRIIYGGSVKPENARDLFGEVDIDGGLIGGASLTAKSFCGIIEGAIK